MDWSFIIGTFGILFCFGVLFLLFRGERKRQKALADRPRYIFQPQEDVTNQELALMVSLMTRRNTFVNLETRSDFEDIKRHFIKL